MLYSSLVEAYESITGTTKRLEITGLLVGLLKQTPSTIVDEVVYLTQGKLYPDYLGIETGIAERFAIKALAIVSGQSENKVTTEYKAKGDLGTAAEELMLIKPQAALGTERLTVDEVYSGLDRIARATGSGSVDTKIRQLTALIGKASSVETKYLIRTALGRLRLGVADMTILDAAAQAFGEGKASRPSLERAYNFSSDLGRLVRRLATEGIDQIQKIMITVGVPVRPMLAERLPDAQAILEKMNGHAAAEYKYDGLRIQAHIGTKNVHLFSRRLENITDQFPDIQNMLRAGVRAKEAVLEGEAVPIDKSTGDLLPFQLVSQRRGRKHKLEKTIEEIPVALFAFDLLYFDGTDYTNSPYPIRREALQKIVSPSERLGLAVQSTVRSPKELDDFMQHAIADGCEGLMIKNIDADSSYKPGSRGWAWIKYKREYKSEMQDTVDLTVVGAFSGRGRRGGAYGALLLSAYDQEEDVFKTVCKCGSGFTDEDLAKLPGLLEKYRVENRHARVDSKIVADDWFVPGLVMEIIGSEITLSPIHTCGMNSVLPNTGLAVRFPRFTGRYRTEKAPEDATAASEIVEMYQNQLKKIQAKPVEA